MATFSRRIAGKRAQQNGDQFETMFAASCARQGIIATRVPDGCKQTKVGLIRVKSPFDWIMSYKGKTAVIDTKTHNEKAFRNSMIDSHQALELVRHEIEGTKAGYCVWLRKTDEFIYIPAKLLCQSMQHRGSIDASTPGVKMLGVNPLVDLRLIFAD